MPRLEIDLELETHRRLEAAARDSGLSVGDFVHRAIARYLTQIESPGVLTDPLLEELWNNEFDAIYDDVET